jgi:hypothetical protein
LVFPLLIIFFPNHLLFAQQSVLPFQSGEKLNYKVSYNWEFVWVDAGKVIFEVDSLLYDGRPAFNFKSFGRSLTSYDWFFKVRDNFESVADADNINPHWFTRKTREGNFRVNNKVNFDYQDNYIIAQTENSQKPYQIDTLLLEGFVLDLQTAVYYARTLEFERMAEGEKIPFRVIIDGEIFDLHGRYLGKEFIENHDGQIYSCHKFSALLVEGTLFKGGEDLFVWLTDDKNHIPILVEAKILVGSVKAYFTGGENILHPMESVVK